MSTHGRGVNTGPGCPLNIFPPTSDLHHTVNSVAKRRLAAGLKTSFETTVEPFLECLFSEATCDSTLIQSASRWLINDYYRDFCYEDDEVDLMKFLVEAVVHPEWDVVPVTVDLLIKVTNTCIR